MKTVYLVRHSEYDNPRNILPGRLPVPLSNNGLQQAKKLAEFFADKKIHHIYSSEVLRCKQTAEIIANKTIPVTYDLRLLEVFSAYQGHWNKTSKLDWSHLFAHRKNLGGEGYDDVQKRMISFWTEIIIPTDKECIIVSHGDPLFLLMLYLDKKTMPPETQELGGGAFPNYLAKGSFKEYTLIR